MIRLLLLVVPLAALAGCKTPNPGYCGNPQGCDAGPGGPSCQKDDDCSKMTETPVCDTTLHPSTCEPCSATNPGVCAGTTPRCESNACVACADDVQDCKGGVCLATGDCADPSHIIHAASTSGKTSDCGDGVLPACSLNAALGMVTTTRNVIKLDDMGMFTQNGFTISNDVTIDARGATLTRADDKGAVLTVMGGKTLTLLGGTVQGAHGPMGSGILCNGAILNVNQTTITTNEQFGIDANPCMLTVTAARIENNSSTGIRTIGGSVTLVRTWLDTNTGGGIDVSGGAQFTIVGNVFANNGSSGGVIGGINILTTASNNRLEFNSIAGNKTQGTISAGVACSANAGFVAKNNIIWSNNGMSAVQVSGGCGHSYSNIGPTAIIGPLNIANNQNNDPKFKDSVNDLHLTSMSPLQMLQQSDPGSSLTDIAAKDIDGEPRVVPVYIGADQYYPPKP